MTESDIERFWSKVNKTDTCWEWTASCRSFGYGAFKLDKKVVDAHRLSYIIAHGDIPQGEGYHGNCVLHKCDNPKCVRPDHLFLGTHQENEDDKIAKNRHLRKLTQSQVEEIILLRDQGSTLKDLAAQFGVTMGMISHIATRKRHVSSIQR